MNEFKLISFDMFQTLVDVNSRRQYVWKRILGDRYIQGLAEECWGEANKLIFGYFSKQMSDSEGFSTVKKVFENSYQELFDKKQIACPPHMAAEILANEHGFADLYEDALPAVEAISKLYKTCLISDTDKDMILPLLEAFKFHKAFISEEFQCYKSSLSGRIFKEALDYFDVQPYEVLHIGDGYSDVLGASKVGIATCWLNRTGAVWKHEVKPDYIVSSLFEAAEILGIKLADIA